MSNIFKFFLITIGCSFIISLATYASQTARVMNGGATVYADKNLKSPIGQIKRGSVVKVGSVARNNGKVLPIIISGRVAWVRVVDLKINWFERDDELEDEYSEERVPRLTEHKVLMSEKIETDEDRNEIKENNYLAFQLHYFNFSYAVGKDYYSDARDESIKGFAGHLLFEHRPPNKMIHWGVGFGMYNNSSEDSAFAWPTLDLMLYFVPLLRETLALDLFAGIHLSGSFRAKYRMIDGTERESSGNALGGSAGVSLRFLPLANLGINVGLEYQTVIVSSMESIEYEGNQYQTGIDSLTGATLFVGCSLKL